MLGVGQSPIVLVHFTNVCGVPSVYQACAGARDLTVGTADVVSALLSLSALKLMGRSQGMEKRTSLPCGQKGRLVCVWPLKTAILREVGAPPLINREIGDSELFYAVRGKRAYQKKYLQINQMHT